MMFAFGLGFLLLIHINKSKLMGSVFNSLAYMIVNWSMLLDPCVVHLSESYCFIEKASPLKLCICKIVSVCSSWLSSTMASM